VHHVGSFVWSTHHIVLSVYSQLHISAVITIHHQAIFSVGTEKNTYCGKVGIFLFTREELHLTTVHNFPFISLMMARR